MTVAEIVAAIQGDPKMAEAIFEKHVVRHRSTHATLNALVQPRLEAAGDEVRLLATGRLVGGRLAGVPVSVKECFPVRGLRTTLGIAARSEHIDDHDAAIVQRLRSAGAIIVGKANVPQAMYLHETENPVWGRTTHPTHADRSPGGSSGGDAALVAAGVVPLAVGTDLAGSIRQPAHACGIAGIVPRSATLGDGGGFDTMPQLHVARPRAGLLARRVDDLRLGLEAIAATAVAGGPHRMLRVGWFDACGPLPPSPAIRRAVRMATASLASRGAAVRQIDGSLWEEAAWVHLAFLSADGGRHVRALFRGSRPEPQVARLLRLAAVPRWGRPPLAALARLSGRRLEARAIGRTGPRSAAELVRLETALDGLRARLAALAAEYDAIVCPVSALPALHHGAASSLLLAAAPCLAANLFDLAAGTVPVTNVRADEQHERGPTRDPVLAAARDADRDSCGLPTGVQVISLRREPGLAEQIVLDVMERLESPGEAA
jgi:fatty acid amide hydrolase